MSLATLFFSGKDWMLPAAALSGAAGLAIVWAYSRASAEKKVWLVCLCLKVLGIAALAVCLLEPLWTGQRAKPGANLFALLADNSQGLQIHDRGNPQSRGEVLRQALAGEKTGWQSSLEENFQLRRYLFDSRLQQVESF